MNHTTIRSLSRIAFPQHHGDGTLTVFAAGADAVPFQIQRIFTIAGVTASATRADHAHRGCSQLLACLSGRVAVEINDGHEIAHETVLPDGGCLLIPPMLWNRVAFEGPATVLAVFCDELYEESDYIRNWDEYLRLKRDAAGVA